MCKLLYAKPHRIHPWNIWMAKGISVRDREIERQRGTCTQTHTHTIHTHTHTHTHRERERERERERDGIFFVVRIFQAKKYGSLFDMVIFIFRRKYSKTCCWEKYKCDASFHWAMQTNIQEDNRTFCYFKLNIFYHALLWVGKQLGISAANLNSVTSSFNKD